MVWATGEGLLQNKKDQRSSSFFISLLDISLRIMPSKGQNFIVLWLNNIPLYINLPQLPYPLFYRGTLRLLPYFGYCKCCCNDHGGAYIFLSECFSFISDKYAEVELLVNMIILVLIYVEPPCHFDSDCTNFHFYQQYTGYFSPHPCLHLLFLNFLIIATLRCMRL